MIFTAADLGHRLEELDAERAAATLEGLIDNRIYRTELEQEYAATRSAYVGAAVTEIAILRAELSGRLEG